MARTLTASDRKRLIKLASTLPKGSPERKAILAGLATRSKKASMSLADLKIELLEELDTFRDGEIAEGRTIAVEAPDGHVYGVYNTDGMTRKEVEAEINAARSLRDLDDPDMQPGAWSRRSAGLSKTKSASRSKAASTGKIIIEVGEDRDRKSDTFPKGQPYVEFDRSKRYYLVSPPGSSRGGKFGEWRDGYGVMPLEPLAEIAALIYAGKLG